MPLLKFQPSYIKLLKFRNNTDKKKRDKRKLSHGSGQTSNSDTGYSRTFTLTYNSTLNGLYSVTKMVKINEHVHDYNRMFKYTVTHIDELTI